MLEHAGGKAQLFFGAFAFADVVNNGEQQLAPAQANRAGIDFHIAGAAVGQAVNKFKTLLARGLGARQRGADVFWRGGVDLADRHAHQHLVRVAIKRAGRRVGVHHLLARRIDQQLDGIIGFEHRLIKGAAFFQLEHGRFAFADVGHIAVPQHAAVLQHFRHGVGFAPFRLASLQFHTEFIAPWRLLARRLMQAAIQAQAVVRVQHSAQRAGVFAHVFRAEAKHRADGVAGVGHAQPLAVHMHLADQAWRLFG